MVKNKVVEVLVFHYEDNNEKSRVISQTEKQINKILERENLNGWRLINSIHTYHQNPPDFEEDDDEEDYTPPESREEFRAASSQIVYLYFEKVE
tara:strand:- start:91 stop:372 length:282 start_codon:yes stop_codon:yes gene_type:complete